LDRKWLHAQMNLAVRVVVHFARRLWPWAPRYGLVRFQQNYVVEHLPPATPEHRALATSPGRCTGCGACDERCPILAGTTPVAADDFGGPQAFVVAGARSSTNLDDIGFALDTLVGPVCTACRACDATCPELIPITRLAASLHAQRAVVDDARRGRVPLLGPEVAARAAAARPATSSPALPASSSTSSQSKEP
jgi:ferredoxin